MCREEVRGMVGSKGEEERKDGKGVGRKNCGRKEVGYREERVVGR